MMRSPRLLLVLPLIIAAALPAQAQGPLGYNLFSPRIAGDRVLVAQADPAQLAVRIDQLEQQVRELTGQVEGLTFQVQQMQQLLLSLQQGGVAPQAPGAPSPEAVSPPAIENAPPTDIPEHGVRPLPGEQEFDPTFDDGTQMAPPGATPSSDQSQPLPLSAPLPVDMDGVEPAPLNLSFTPDTPTGNPDADAQFTAAYEALTRGDLDFAEDQFSQFLALYPDSPHAQDAANWLGEALLARGAYQDAAEILLDGYTAAPESPRAPDLMLRLGIALVQAEERETACRTFAEIANRFTNLTPEFSARLGAETAEAQCPPA